MLRRPWRSAKSPASMSTATTRSARTAGKRRPERLHHRRLADATLEVQDGDGVRSTHRGADLLAQGIFVCRLLGSARDRSQVAMDQLSPVSAGGTCSPSCSIPSSAVPPGLTTRRTGCGTGRCGTRRGGCARWRAIAARIALNWDFAGIRTCQGGGAGAPWRRRCRGQAARSADPGSRPAEPAERAAEGLRDRRPRLFIY